MYHMVHSSGLHGVHTLTNPDYFTEYSVLRKLTFLMAFLFSKNTSALGILLYSRQSRYIDLLCFLPKRHPGNGDFTHWCGFTVTVHVVKFEISYSAVNLQNCELTAKFNASFLLN